MKKNKKTVLKNETDQETIESEAKKIEETNNLITAEDLVEQAFYKTHAPDCCADKDAENMLGMLGANIVDTDIYHDEDNCPFKDEDTCMNNQVAESEDNEITSVENEIKISM